MANTALDGRSSSQHYKKAIMFLGCVLMTCGLRAGTIGLWTFEGTPGDTIAVGSTFANKVDGSTFPLQSVDRYGNAVSAGKRSSYVAPCGADYRTYWKPTRLGTETPLGSSYHIAGAGGNAGCPLSLNDETGALNLQTFTLEFIVRFSEPIDNWSMFASRNYHYFGAGLGTYYNGIYVKPVGWEWTYHYCCQTNADNDVGYGDINLGQKNLNDGKWHHIAFRADGTEHKASFLIDYQKVATINLPGPLAYDYNDGNGVERNPWIFGNHQVYGNYSWTGDFAAIRLSDEHLEAADFLRMGATAADGRTLLWLPLDSDFSARTSVDVSPTNGTFGTRAETVLVNGTAAFTNRMANVCPVDGAGNRLRANNTGCLSLRGGVRGSRAQAVHAGRARCDHGRVLPECPRGGHLPWQLAGVPLRAP